MTNCGVIRGSLLLLVYIKKNKWTNIDTHPVKHPIAASLTRTTIKSRGWKFKAYSSTGNGYGSNRASITRGRTFFDRTNSQSCGRSEKDHKRLRQYCRRVSSARFRRHLRSSRSSSLVISCLCLLIKTEATFECF